VGAVLDTALGRRITDISEVRFPRPTCRRRRSRRCGGHGAGPQAGGGDRHGRGLELGRVCGSAARPTTLVATGTRRGRVIVACAQHTSGVRRRFGRRLSEFAHLSQKRPSVPQKHPTCVALMTNTLNGTESLTAPRESRREATIMSSARACFSACLVIGILACERTEPTGLPPTRASAPARGPARRVP